MRRAERWRASEREFQLRSADCGLGIARCFEHDVGRKPGGGDHGGAREGGGSPRPTTLRRGGTNERGKEAEALLRASTTSTQRIMQTNAFEDDERCLSTSKLTAIKEEEAPKGGELIENNEREAGVQSAGAGVVEKRAEKKHGASRGSAAKMYPTSMKRGTYL